MGSQPQAAKLPLEVEALRRNLVRLHQEAQGYQQPQDTQPKQESLNHRSHGLDWRLPAAFRNCSIPSCRSAVPGIPPSFLRSCFRVVRLAGSLYTWPIQRTPKGLHLVSMYPAQQ